MTLHVKFDGKTLVPQEAVDLPIGADLEIEIRPRAEHGASKPPLQELMELADQFPANPDAPADGAAQHDHYLYGTPKRENP
jgi:hypothetical protein